MEDSGWFFLFALLFLDEKADGNALLDVEHIFVLRAIWCAFLLLDIPMEIEHVNVVEGFHEALAHSSEGGVVQISVIGNKGEDAVAGAFDPPLCKANELHIVIVEPFRVPLT